MKTVYAFIGLAGLVVFFKFIDRNIKLSRGIMSILDEISSYKDSPGEQIFDDFEEQIYEGHQIGSNILGEEQLIKNFTISDIQKFIEKNYSTDEKSWHKKPANFIR